MKFLLTSSFLLCTLLSLGQSNRNKVEHYTSSDVLNISNIQDNYLLADDVLFRTCSSDTCEVIKKLPIGTPIKLLQKHDQSTIINGIESNWYEVSVNGIVGFVWGGLIAQNQFGSSNTGGIKFVLGLEKVLEETYIDKYDGQTYPATAIYTQIRAFKDGVQLAKYSLRSLYRYYDISASESYGYGTSNLGPCGIKGIQDVIQLHIPCRGGCGCSTGDSYIAWDGTDFHFLTEAFGTADAQYSEGDGIIFPSNMNGEEGYIIRSVNRVLFDETEDQETRQDKREQYIEYYTWNGNQLSEPVKTTKKLITLISDDY